MRIVEPLLKLLKLTSTKILILLQLTIIKANYDLK